MKDSNVPVKPWYFMLAIALAALIGVGIVVALPRFGVSDEQARCEAAGRCWNPKKGLCQSNMEWECTAQRY